MKRKHLLLMPALVIGLSLSWMNPTFAAIKDKGTTWWSVEELIDFYQEVEQEKLDECGDDLDCQIEFGYNMVERGPKYSALSNFLETQIWITAVNPANETVKVFYFDDDMMLRRMGIEEKIHLQHLYMGWFEEWKAQIFNYNHEQFTSGEIIGLHTMYDGGSSIDGPDWIPAWEEVELSVGGSDLRENHSGVIDYAVFAEDNMFNAQGTFNYSNCLKAPDYVDGMECKLMISGDQWASYFPPREQIMEEIDASNQDDNPDSGSAENPDLDSDLDSNEPESEVGETSTTETTEAESNSTPDVSDPINAGPFEAPSETSPATPALADTTPQSTNSTNENSLRTQEYFASRRLPKAPNTGKSMSVAKRDANLMPWWLIMMEVLGGILMLWWFIPVRAIKKKDRLKNRRKSPKKLLKTLDKKSRVR